MTGIMVAFSNQLVSATPPAIQPKHTQRPQAALSLVSTALLPVLLKVFDRRPLARLLTRLVQVPVIYVVDMSGTPRARTAALCIPIAIVANPMRVYKTGPLGLLGAKNSPIANSKSTRTSMTKDFVTALGHILCGTGVGSHVT